MTLSKNSYALGISWHANNFYSELSSHMKTQDCCIPVKEKTSLLPLYILLTFVLISSILLSYVFPSQVFMMYLMGIWFLSFGVLKLIDLPSFAMSFSWYDFIAKKWRWYWYIYPFIEIILWFLYIWDTSMTYMYSVSAVAFVLSLLWLTSAYRVVSSGKTIVCACMGTTWKLPMTKVTILENSVMILMILYMIIFPNSMMNMGSMSSDMKNMPMNETTVMPSEMMPSSSNGNDAMREHCKTMPEMAGCEKYK